jgi:hypothetical protein
MIPSEADQATQSDAERRLFQILKTHLSAEWTVLHSVGLAYHPQKPWTEIDFILLGPPGIYCLEVKGGRVCRNDRGQWLFTDRNDRTHTKSEGPWGQVGSASAALRRFLIESDSSLRSTVVGYGVVMPDIKFSQVGPDIEPDVLYDERNLEEPFGCYLARLVTYWQLRLARSAATTLDRPLRDRTVDLLRGQFDFRPSLSARIGRIKHELIRLTEEQTRVMNALEENPRVVVSGAAGTGKTVLAIEEAMRLTAEGLSVGYLCFNWRLADYVRETCRGRDSLAVDHLHGLMRERVEAAGLTARLPAGVSSDDLNSLFLPDLCLEALLANPVSELFDCIIVDEAQDLIRESYLDVLDLLVEGGLDKGRWRFFHDPNQDVYQGMGRGGMGRLLSSRPARLRLSVNCRNTAPIAVSTSILSGVQLRETLTTEGPEVVTHWYRDNADQRRQLANELNRLLSEGVPTGDIVLLAPRRIENTCLSGGLEGVPYRVSGRTSVTANARPELAFRSIQSFKGLEADAVLLFQLDNLSGEQRCAQLYVGASRARAYLSVFLNETSREEYAERAREFGQSLVTIGHDLTSCPRGE